MAAASILGFRKLCYAEPLKCPPLGFSSFRETRTSATTEGPFKKEKVVSKRERQSKQWRCIDSCCWSIGCLFTAWWFLLFLFHCLPPTLTLPGFRVTELPGDRLRREEGLMALHPVVLVPGIVTGGLELWEGKPCSEGLFRKRLWGGSFTEIFKRPLCWLEHLSLDNETGLDPPGIRVRAVPGLVTADYFTPGYFVWAALIENLAKIGYEEKNLHMAAYDWRLSFQNTEVRDQALSRLKSQIELMYLTNGNKRVVVVPHSMGVLYFLHFLKWVEMPAPLGGGGGPTWCAKHIKAVMNIAPAFLGVPKAVTNIISNEGKDIAAIRAMARRVLDSEILGLQTLEHFMRVSRTWDSAVSLIPKGGETIWGSLDWSPEEGFSCVLEKRTNLDSPVTIKSKNNTEGRELPHGNGLPIFNSVCQEVWTEHDEISRGSIGNVTDNKAYTSRTVLDLLQVLAPKMMKRGEAHFSHGIADDLDDPKYDDYKYWSNPLETKLPDAPEMETYCLYGVGIPSERSYIYKTSPTSRCKSIPFRIDSSAEGDDTGCLRGGVCFVDGDGSVPVISAGFMCARGWRGKTRFNPSGIPTYLREYRHKAPASLLEGRGLESGAHIDIMGNVALIEDVLRVAAGASGVEIGGDRILSEIMRMSERIDLQL